MPNEHEILCRDHDEIFVQTVQILHSQVCKSQSKHSSICFLLTLGIGTGKYAKKLLVLSVLAKLTGIKMGNPRSFFCFTVCLLILSFLDLTKQPEAIDFSYSSCYASYVNNLSLIFIFSDLFTRISQVQFGHQPLGLEEEEEMLEIIIINLEVFQLKTSIKMHLNCCHHSSVYFLYV